MYSPRAPFISHYLPWSPQILAGAHVDTLTPQKQNALHIAATQDHHAICSILLENNINFDQLDDKWNNRK